MLSIVVYTQDACASCRHVERFFQDRGVPFTAKDIGGDADAMREFLELGYLTTPVTVIDGTVVAGFQPKRLAELLARSSAVKETRS